MEEIEKTDKEFVKNSYGVMNELSLLAAACDAMTYKVSPIDDEDNVVGFFHGAASVLNRCSEMVCEFIERFEELLELSDKGEVAAGKPNEAAGR